MKRLRKLKNACRGLETGGNAKIKSERLDSYKGNRVYQNVNNTVV